MNRKSFTTIILLIMLLALLTPSMYRTRVDTARAASLDPWAKSYGGTGGERTQSVERVYAGCKSETAYIVAGSTTSWGAGDGDAWILKLTLTGDIVWQKTYGGASWEIANSIQEISWLVSPDGPSFRNWGFIVAGITHSFGSGQWDFWVLKLRGNGGIEWQKTYGGPYGDDACSIRQTTDGGYVVAGSTASFGAGTSAIWILKLDGNGGIGWQRTYGLPGHVANGVYSIQQTTDGGYIVGGHTNYFDGPCYDSWILKLDSNGNIQWQWVYYLPSSSEFANSIQQTTDGGYVVATSTMAFGAGNYDFWILKLDSGGNIQWEKTYGGANYDHANSIYQTLDGGYVVAGYTYSFGAGDSDFWVLKLDQIGNIEWEKTYGGPDRDGVATYMNCEKSIQQTYIDQGYIVGGITESFGAGGEDFWVLKLGINGNLCIMRTSNAIVGDTAATVIDPTPYVVIEDTTVVPVDTPVTPADSAASVETQCPAPIPVGGVWVPINKFELLAPWIGYASVITVAAASLVYVKRRKKQQN